MKHYIIIFLALTGMMFTSCKHDKLDFEQETKNYRPAADFIRNNYDLSLFYAAIERAGMSAELNGPGPFTILAPNNKAFNEIGILSAADLAKMPVDKVKELVQLHVLPQTLRESNLAPNSVDVRFKTIGTRELLVTMSTNPYGAAGNRNAIYFHGCLTEVKDVVVTNGVLQVLQQVIKDQPGTVQDLLSQHEEFSLFVGALKRFGFWEQLKSGGPWTILAPTNAALKANGLDEQAIAALSPDKYIMARLFGSYIIHKQHYFFSDIRAFKTMTGTSDPLRLNIKDDTYLLEIASLDVTENGVLKIRYACSIREDRNHQPLNAVPVERKGIVDYNTDNGVVHQLDGLLLKPEQAIK
ncbi:Uncaracterized surface protein containing fasciclin (FAS1) repeats [Chitinophaga eiseniae]|uniref:Uncaracterized surface protein containing fasciclin (FAS1) repeats n=1 Tax=Chitinophaga eiseniae TaxID=634771 RepID=A0A1T4QJ63_9BACT|nr:fasciclin domain-containing protein [Chitinophaga eiseniae]SKA03830.1 Uncaracterized surface protein containing fasciclin (FAS1) repeats [Chitinophaga eiseniae]